MSCPSIVALLLSLTPSIVTSIALGNIGTHVAASPLHAQAQVDGVDVVGVGTKIATFGLEGFGLTIEILSINSQACCIVIGCIGFQVRQRNSEITALLTTRRDKTSIVSAEIADACS